MTSHFADSAGFSRRLNEAWSIVLTFGFLLGFATAADRYGMSPKKLQRQLSEPPSFFGTPRRERVRQVAVLRACIADEVAKDGWIYQGLVGHLLPRNLTHVLKVCLGGTQDYRVERGIAEGFSKRDAQRRMTKDDELRAEIDAVVKAANGELSMHQRIAGWRLWPERDFPRTHTMKIRRNPVREWAGGDVALQVREIEDGSEA